MRTISAISKRGQRATFIPRRSRVEGSIVINTAIAMSLILIVLFGTEIGYLFYIKRELQKTVDLAALAGAQSLDGTSSAAVCEAAKEAARANAAVNFPNPKIKKIQCGRWTTAPVQNQDDHFIEGSGGGSYNAIHLEIHQDNLPRLLPFFNANRIIDVQATALLDMPISQFSVGSQLLRTNSAAPLMKILQSLGVDLELLKVLDADGLATIKITPAGLLKDLGLGLTLEGGVLTPSEVASLEKVSLGKLLDVALQAITQDEALHAKVDALAQNLISAGLDKVELNTLTSDTGHGGLLTLKTPDPSNAAALNTEIDLGSVLRTAISIAAAGRGVSIPDLSLLDLVNVQAGIVEPPSIGIGGVDTRAYNAQVRLYVDIDSDNLLGGALKPLISDFLGTRIHLPVYLDLINGYGRLSSMDCLKNPREATIDVTSSILRACVGRVDDAAVRFSQKNLCETDLANEKLVRLLNLPLPKPAQIQINALPYTETITLKVGETRSTNPNPAEIGSLVDSLVAALSGTLDQLLGGDSGVATSEKSDKLATQYLELTKNPNGFYDAAAVINILQNGSIDQKFPGLGDWDRTVTVGLLFPRQEQQSVWKVLQSQTQLNGGLLELIGLGQSCAGLLQALAWNTCVKSKVIDALDSAPPGVINDAFPDTATPGTGKSTGLLYGLLSPLINLLRPVLNSVGSFLSTTLANTLGIELGRTDAKLIAVQCARSKLVY